MSDRRHDDDPTGHQRTAGQALFGMGLLAAGLYVATRALQVELGFIDGPAILVIFAVFSGVGAAMVWASSQEAT